jgi:hypothetical protein
MGPEDVTLYMHFAQSDFVRHYRAQIGPFFSVDILEFSIPATSFNKFMALKANVDASYSDSFQDNAPASGNTA